MQPTETDHVRTVVERYRERLRQVPASHLGLELRRLVASVEAQPILAGIVAELSAADAEARAVASSILAMPLPDPPLTARLRAQVAYLVITGSLNGHDNTRPVEIGASVHGSWGTAGGANQDQAVAAFRREFVEPLLDYLEDSLDSFRVTGRWLQRYRKSREAFRRQHLFDQYRADTRRGEKLLARDLHEWLHDQGATLHIEPLSTSGEIDLIEAGRPGERIAADAKVFDGASRSADYVAKGIAQVHRYLVDHSEPVGFLVVFQVAEPELRFEGFEVGVNQMPLFDHNGRRVYVEVVDIVPDRPSASKRGKVGGTKGAVVLRADDVVKALAAEQP